VHPGDVVDGRFTLEAEIARGGMGRLLRATDGHTGRPVALKLIATDDPSAEDRFAREAQVLARVRHPALVEHVAHGMTADGTAYLAMEWLEGEDLRNHLGARSDATLASGKPTVGFLSPADTLTLGRRVASALAELHRHGIVHRDVKPANLFLVGGDVGQVKLLDLGAAALRDARPLTMTGVLVGTPAYMAPEQVRAEGKVGPAADVWALGCVLYECLAGTPAFRAHHIMALLAKILLDAPPSIHAARPDLPAPLLDLVQRTLEKDPDARHPNGEMLAVALEVIDTSAPTPAYGIRPSTPSLGGSERRVRCVVVGALPAGAGAARAEVELAVERAGASLVWLSPGSFVVTFEPPGAPSDQAVRAGRIALALRHAVPELSLAIGLGQAESDGRVPVGEAVDRAASLLGEATRGEVRVQSSTVPLLEARFDLSQHGSAGRLVGERTKEATRTLLGKPTVSVGRRRELGTLSSLWDHTVEEHMATAALVTAEAGMGKTRLRYELLRALRRRGESVTVLEGQGDSLSAGSPFGMIAPALRRWAGATDASRPDETRRRLRERLARALDGDDLERVWVFLAELIGAPLEGEVPDALRAARQDPMLLGEAMRRAFTDWLAAECARRPVLVILEDLHWGDVPSVRFVDAALARCEELPLMVLALARPEVKERFGDLFERRGLQEIHLASLSQRASVQLIKQVLGEDVDEDLARKLAVRAGGNAFYLEELIRAAAEDERGALPDTVIGMVQTRLDALGHEAKTVLRAAAVFGEVFWTRAVEGLLGDAPVSAAEWLRELSEREVVSRRHESRFPAETEWRFRHALMRDGAYALLTEEDREVGHRLAGEWLRRAGEQDAVVLAEHFDRGGARNEAIRWFHRAADQALEGNDLEAAVERVSRAAQAGAAGVTLGSLRALESLARYWQSDYAGARERGEEAEALLPAGSRDWYRALGSATVASARLGDFDGVDALFERVLASRPAADAAAEQLIALCRGTFQLIFHGRFDEADRVLARVAELAAAEDLDALTLGQVHHVRGVRAAMVGDVSTFLHHLSRAVDAFERAGDVRNASLERTTVAWCHAELGDFVEAERVCRANLKRCEDMGAQQAITYAKVNLGYILTHVAGARGEARAVLEQAIAECRAVGNPRLMGWAIAHRAALEHLEGEHRAEEASAREAAALLSVSPGLEAWALGLHARALALTGRAEEGLAAAERAMATLERLGGMLQGEAVPPLALAMARDAAGDADGAAAAIADARARLETRADRIEDEAARRGFLSHPESLAILAWKPSAG